MTGLTVNALTSALQGLNVSQQLLDLTSQNISNAQTAGYTSKTLGVNDLVAGGEVIGVATGTVQRSVDQALQQSVWSQTSQSSQLSTVDKALSGIQSTFGTADAGTNYSSYLTDLKDDFTQLSGSPSSTTLQQQTVSDAQTFASSLNQTATAITTARNTAESGIAQSVASINTGLTTIAQLNVQIAQAGASGGSTADLQDQRDQAVASLSQQLNISTYTTSTGVMVVQTGQGQVLADTQAHQLVFTSQAVGANSTYPATLSGVYIDSATTGYDLASSRASPGGTLGGELQLRDQILPQQQAEVDEVAEQTANRFNAQGMKLFTDSSGNIPANVPATYTGFASQITVNPAMLSAPSDVQQGTSGVPIDPSDNTVIQNVLNYTFGLDQNSSGTPNTPFNVSGLGSQSNITTPLSTVSTLEAFAQQTMTNQASTAANYTSQSTFTANYLTSLQGTLQNQSSVNLDTQVANLTVYENSYSCAAQVVTTEQKMMADLLSAISG